MKLLISVIILSILAACSQPQSTAAVEPINVIATVPKPKPITTRPISFRVITDRDDDIFQDQKVLYAITVKDYESLSFNTQELLRYIRDQNSIIRYYESSVSN